MRGWLRIILITLMMQIRYKVSNHHFFIFFLGYDGGQTINDSLCNILDGGQTLSYLFQKEDMIYSYLFTRKDMMEDRLSMC